MPSLNEVARYTKKLPFRQLLLLLFAICSLTFGGFSGWKGQTFSHSNGDASNGRKEHSNTMTAHQFTSHNIVNQQLTILTTCNIVS